MAAEQKMGGERDFFVVAGAIVYRAHVERFNVRVRYSKYAEIGAPRGFIVTLTTPSGQDYEVISGAEEFPRKFLAEFGLSPEEVASLELAYTKLVLAEKAVAEAKAKREREEEQQQHRAQHHVAVNHWS